MIILQRSQTQGWTSWRQGVEVSLRFKGKCLAYYGKFSLIRVLPVIHSTRLVGKVVRGVFAWPHWPSGGLLGLEKYFITMCNY